MIANIQRAIRKGGLFGPGEHVLVGVSGGCDSVALLTAMAELAPALDLRVTAAHLHHGIRRAAADADAGYVRELAGRLGLACVCGRADVPGRARRAAISLEMAAREARYAFFFRTARRIDAQAVATAHTADDQAETLILKLARGAGPQGLSGIAARTCRDGIRIVRPMLGVNRGEAAAFLRKKGVDWREDETNRDLSYLRNRVRHELLPLLETGLNPGIRRALVRTAGILEAENSWLESIAAEILNACRLPLSGQSDGLDVKRLCAQPLAARRRVLRRWLIEAGVPPAGVDFGVVERLEQLLAKTRGSGRVPLADDRRMVIREYDRLCLATAEPPGEPAPGYRESVSVGGETVLPGPDLRVRTWLEPGLVRERPVRPGRLPARASISRRAMRGRRLYVRSWRAGDRIQPLGLDGSRKLQDIFVDAKVPRSQRGRVPLFECGGELVWIPGYRVARGWHVRDPQTPSLQIAVERI